jgi:hypothetical protein
MRKDAACAAARPNFFMAAKPLRLAADTNVLVDVEDEEGRPILLSPLINVDPR